MAQAVAQTLEQLQTHNTFVLPSQDWFLNLLLQDTTIEVLDCSNKKLSAETIEKILANVTHPLPQHLDIG